MTRAAVAPHVAQLVDAEHASYSTDAQTRRAAVVLLGQLRFSERAPYDALLEQALGDADAGVRAAAATACTSSRCHVQPSPAGGRGCMRQ